MVIAVKQSEKSKQTDIKVAESAARAVRTVGVDQMALTRVAADAGFSSGAIYARCDDRSELVVLAWEKSFWPMLSEILTPLIDAVISSDTQDIARIGQLFAAASAADATPDLGSAMEVIIASRRDEVIAEVVQRDINTLLDDRGVGPSTDGAHRQSVVSAISTLFGASLLNSAYEFKGRHAIDPTGLIYMFTQAAVPPQKPASAPHLLKNAEPYKFPTTHDDVRDALIAASEYVIARSGIHRATVSRIARRAGVSVGAIYGLYENKDSLVSDCLEVLFPPQSKRDADDWARVFTAPDQRAVVTDILANYMSPSYQQWRRFRLESIIAARHSPAIATQLSIYAAQSRETILRASTKAPNSAPVGETTGLSARASVLGLSVLEIVDPTICTLDWRWVPIGRDYVVSGHA
jgi:AcrR family transcriptional regulator